MARHSWSAFIVFALVFSTALVSCTVVADQKSTEHFSHEQCSKDVISFFPTRKERLSFSCADCAECQSCRDKYKECKFEACIPACPDYMTKVQCAGLCSYCCHEAYMDCMEIRCPASGPATSPEFLSPEMSPGALPVFLFPGSSPEASPEPSQ